MACDCPAHPAHPAPACGLVIIQRFFATFTVPPHPTWQGPPKPAGKEGGSEGGAGAPGGSEAGGAEGDLGAGSLAPNSMPFVPTVDVMMLLLKGYAGAWADAHCLAGRRAGRDGRRAAMLCCLDAHPTSHAWSGRRAAAGIFSSGLCSALASSMAPLAAPCSTPFRRAPHSSAPGAVAHTSLPFAHISLLCHTLPCAAMFHYVLEGATIRPLAPPSELPEQQQVGGWVGGPPLWLTSVPPCR